MSLRTNNTILLLFFALLCQPALAATSWSYRLPATKDAIDAKTQASFRLNCGKQQQKIQTKNFVESRQLKADQQAQKNCLQGTFTNARYFKRTQEDPIAYRTVDGKPYLELYFSGASNLKPNVSGKKRLGLKLILHDVKGKRKYPVSHQNETFQPRYDDKKPIKRIKLSDPNRTIPVLNYSKGRHIPLIIDNFVAMHENRSNTFSSGERIYGVYQPADIKKIIPTWDQPNQSDRLGEVEITNIGKDGKIEGKYSIRLLQEYCNDPLAISDCSIISSHIEGEFVAHEFKTDKAYVKQELKPRKKKKYKTSAASSSQIVSTAPMPRLHKPLLGYQCSSDIAKPCKAADKTFERYLACLEKYNFKKNDAQDTARKNLRKCSSMYDNYEQQSLTCRKRFAEDQACTG